MNMDGRGLPTIKLEIDLDYLRLGVVQEFSKHQNHIERMVTEEIEKILTVENIRSVIQSEVGPIASEALKKGIANYFQYGEGHRVIRKMIADILEKE